MCFARSRWRGGRCRGTRTARKRRSHTGHRPPAGRSNIGHRGLSRNLAIRYREPEGIEIPVLRGGLLHHRSDQARGNRPRGQYCRELRTARLTRDRGPSHSRGRCPEATAPCGSRREHASLRGRSRRPAGPRLEEEAGTYQREIKTEHQHSKGSEEPGMKQQVFKRIETFGPPKPMRRCDRRARANGNRQGAVWPGRGTT